jgi:hypothetical protein
MEAKAYTKGFLPEAKDVVLELAGRAIHRSVLGLGNNGTKVATDKTYQDIRSWSQGLLVESLLYGKGKATSAKNVTAYAEGEQRRITNTRKAFRRTMNTAMSSFTKSKNDTAPEPKQWGSFGHLEWFSLANLSFDARGDMPIYSKTNMQSRLVFKRIYPARSASRAS